MSLKTRYCTLIFLSLFGISLFFLTIQRASAASNLAGEEEGTLSGYVLEAGSGTPIIGAQIEAWFENNSTSTTTDGDGFYSLVLSEGVYTVTASASGYFSSTQTSVDIQSDQETSLNFSLHPGGNPVVEGIIRDASTGWPLYARIDIPELSASPIWSDPASGYYSLALPPGTYTFQVSTQVDGYLAQAESVSVSGPVEQDFNLQADLASCAAPGYTHEYSLFESFDSESLPPGWLVVDNPGEGHIWRFDDPGERGNQTGGAGGFAIVDSDYYGEGAAQDTELWSPPVDLSSESSVILEFDTDFKFFESGLVEVAEVDASTDGGSTWVNLWHQDQVGGDFNGHVLLDISSVAAHEPAVLIRFHYFNASFEWWWQIDNVTLNFTCVPQQGGLVVGSVFDANSGEAVLDARISTEEGFSAVSLPTPDDPQVADGFFTLFSFPGETTITATATSYGNDQQEILVPEGAAVWQDFHLPAGKMGSENEDLNINLGLGFSATLTLELTNQGATESFFRFYEQSFSSPQQVALPPANLGFPRGAYAPSTGPAPVQRPSPPLSPSSLSMPQGSNAYSLDVLNDSYTVFDIGSPETLPNITSFLGSGNFIGAGEYLHGRVYMIDTANNMWAIDAASGAILNTYSASPPAGTQTYSGLAHDPISGTMYASATDCTTSNLYQIFPQNGNAVLIGQISNAPCIIGIAADIHGDLWGYDIVTDELLEIDQITAEGTVIGSIGFDANFGQGMGWDPVTDTLYFAAFNNDTLQPELRTVDRSTGNSNIVGIPGANFPGDQSQLTWLGINNVDIPWILTSPLSGTLPAGGRTEIQVTLLTTTDTITNTGTYSGFLVLQNDTPYGGLSIPVVMSASLPVVAADLGPGGQAAGNPGDTIYYTLWLSNTGNVPDTFDISVDSHWNATVSISQAFLNPGAGTPLTLWVEIPWGVMNGESDPISVRVRSKVDPDFSKTTLFPTTALFAYKIYLPTLGQ